jgi:predicted Rossmann fold flavoprotein
MDKHYDVIVVGAGAAGLIAAGEAAKGGASTLLIEKMNMPGRKLKITGKGRCNITNQSEISDHIAHIKPNGKFLRQAYSRFFVNDLMTFLESIGLLTIVERGNRVFPASQSASDVVDALVSWNMKQGVQFLYNTAVSDILTYENTISGVRTKGSTIYNTNKVILTTGGKTYPATGSTGDGYRFSETLGHNITEITPSLVPLETEGETAMKLQGLSLANVNVSLWVNEKKMEEEFGEMLFTHFGLTGPVILTLSRSAVKALQQGNKTEIRIDMKPALDEKKLDARLMRDIDSHGKMKFQNILKLLLPSKMIPVCTELTGIDADKQCCQISAAERAKLRNWLKDLRFHVIGHRPYNEAIITAGGVDTKEINPSTMESKKIKGLYFAGEILDLDADTGGYNLQLAFSTGWLAGNSASETTII